MAAFFLLRFVVVLLFVIFFCFYFGDSLASDKGGRSGEVGLEKARISGGFFCQLTLRPNALYTAEM